MKHLALISSLLMCLQTGAVLSAEPAEATTGPDAETRVPAPVSEDNADSALEEEIRAADEAAASNAAPANRNEPFIPTVQISEDLSVSFPVDI